MVVSFFREKGRHHQLPYRVTPTLVTPLDACSCQFSLASSARAHQVQTGGHRIPSSPRHCTSVLIRPTTVRRRSAVETPRSATFVDLQSSRRPPIATCHCRRSLICCCWPASLEQCTCWRPVCSITCNIPSETENILIPAIIPRRCSVTASP